jgi:hypothetical protein
MQYKAELICAYVGFWTLMTLPCKFTGPRMAHTRRTMMARHNPHRAEYTKKRKSKKLKAADERNRRRGRK